MKQVEIIYDENANNFHSTGIRNEFLKDFLVLINLPYWERIGLRWAVGVYSFGREEIKREGCA